MSDVSIRFLSQLVRAARARGLEIDPLRIELGLPEPSPDDVRDFVPWDTAEALMTGCMALAGGPDGMRAIGRELAKPEILNGVVGRIFRMAVGPRQLYTLVARWAGPGAFQNVQADFDRLPGGRLRFDLRLPETQRDCPALFHGNAGFFETAPRLLGLGDSVVELQLEPRRGVLLITPPPATSVLSRMRRLFGLLGGTEAAMRELQEQHDAITRQRAELEAERVAREHSEQRFTDIFQASPLPAVVAPVHGERLLDANARFLEIFGITREQALATPIEELPIWLSPAQREETRERLLATPAPDAVDLSYRDRLGRERHGIASALRSNFDGEPVTLLQVLDVTERRQAKLALEESESRHRAMLRAVPDAILIFKRDGTCVDAHLPASATGKLGLEDPVGHKPAELGFPPEETTRILKLIERVCRRGEMERFEFALQGPGFHRKCEARVVPCSSDQVLAMVRDVTERERLEESLRQSQKMEALGQLAGGIAHDFNNLLTAIIGYAEIQLATVEPDGTAADAAEQILSASERAARLTQQLLTFGRRRIVQAHPIDLNEAIQDTLELLARLIGEDIRVETDLCNGPTTVVCDPVEIEQVLMNLALNARDAMPQGGTLRIATRAATRTNGARDGADDGRCVRLRIEDTGVGMDEGVIRRAFEPFFTTKPSGRSTGLGLATVYGIVQRIGGSIGLESKPDQGTRIEILLPRAEGRPDRPPVPTRRGPTGRGETLLIVEDEKPLRDLLGAALRGDGYRVLLASNGIEALALEQQHGEDIDALVTDAVMPRMGGVELVTELRQRRPDIPALFISGYPDRPVPAECRLLEKPFRMPVLGRSVREMLDGRSAAV